MAHNTAWWDKRENQFYKGLEEYFFKEEDHVEKPKYYCENKYCRYRYTNSLDCGVANIRNMMSPIDKDKYMSKFFSNCEQRKLFIKDFMPTEEEYEEGNLTKEIV